MNVLILPSGSEIGIEIVRSLSNQKGINLYGANSRSSSADHLLENNINDFPPFNDKDNFLNSLNSLIKKCNIDFIFPAYDDLSVFLTDNSENINAKIIAPSKEINDICRSKKKTYELFKEELFIPKVYKAEDITENDFPIFAKPDIGQGSYGARRIENIIEFNTQIDLIKERDVLCELLTGVEYTVDCLGDESGELLLVSPRERSLTKNGISIDSKTVSLSNEFETIANSIQKKLKIKGAWFFQVKRTNNGTLKLLEIAPRIAGTMSVTRAIGYNLPLMTLLLYSEIEVKPLKNMESVRVRRSLVNFYEYNNLKYSNVYLDFDDTLTVGEKVNSKAMAFVYDCLNKGISLKLITRHSKNIHMTLEKLNINEKIFDEIIHIKEGKEPKSKYISANNSIFIDDSFKERQEVHMTHNIPVFDIDAFEYLLDWRV